MTEKKFPYISSLGIMIERNQKDIQTAQDEENKISKIVEIPIDTFSRERPPPRLHVSFPPAGTSLKFNISPAGTPARPGRHPPSLPLPPLNESLQPMATVPGYHGDSFAWQVAAATTNHPPPAPSISSRLVCSACHWYDEPIAHSEKIFNHASRTRGWWWWWWLLRRWW